MKDVAALLTRDPAAVAAAVAKERAARRLIHFIEYAWPVLEPTTPFVRGWAIEAICEHIEALIRGDIRRLLINIPPGLAKSLSTVFGSAWAWVQDPSMRIISASYAESLSIRDNRKVRQLVMSERYQRNWGDRVSLVDDQNQRVKFETSATGFRLATSVGGVGTGERGDLWFVDDPNNAQEAESEAKRESTNRWFSEVLSTRLNDAERSSICVIQQRVHARDVSGLILAEGLKYEHLCLPMEYEVSRRCFTSVPRLDGSPAEPVTKIQLESESVPRWLTEPELAAEESLPPDFEPEWRELFPQDRRTREGELLFPERFPASAVDEQKQALSAHGGSHAVAGQFQQRPSPREGGLMKKSDFGYVDAIPDGGDWVRAWDLAASTRARSDFTVGVKMAKIDGRIYIAHVARFKAGPGEVERKIAAIAEADGRGVRVSIPQDPGAAGKTAVSAFAAQLHGFKVQSSPETGDKGTRITPFAAQVECGNVFLLRGQPWVEAFLAELCAFPSGAHDDQVDATSRAYRELLERRRVRIHIGVVG